MKRLLLVFVAVVFAAVSMNAQVAGDASAISYKGGNLYQDGIKLSPNQVLQALGQETYDNVYKPAKGMRTAGIVLLSVGATSAAIGAGMAISGAVLANRSEPGSSIGGGIETGFGLIFGVSGVAVGAVGGILMGVGNKRLKNIVPASNGAGLALNF